MVVVFAVILILCCVFVIIYDQKSSGLKQNSYDKTLRLYQNDIVLELQKKFRPHPHILSAKPIVHAESDTDTSEYAIDIINKIRSGHGKNPIVYDSRIDDLALARAQDMYRYGYLDHKNPYTETCPNNIKSDFGFDQNESLIENAALYEYDEFADPPIADIVDAWMKSTGHRYNLLYYDHKAGGFACYDQYCVFLGMTENGYTGSSNTECHTTKEGVEFFKKLVSCSDQKMLEYESLQKEFKELRMKYEKIPHIVRSEIEYLNAESMYKKLEDARTKIESFRC